MVGFVGSPRVWADWIRTAVYRGDLHCRVEAFSGADGGYSVRGRTSFGLLFHFEHDSGLLLCSCSIANPFPQLVQFVDGIHAET